MTTIGINYGRSFCSFAIADKNGKVSCVANEDGQRQIAAAVAFAGEETVGFLYSKSMADEYIGSQALPQLIKNADNTVLYMRDGLLKGVGGDLDLACASLDKGYSITSNNTQRELSSHEANVMLLTTIIQSAEDYIGSEVEGVVMALPGDVDEQAIESINKVAADVSRRVPPSMDMKKGVKIVQVIPDYAAACLGLDRQFGLALVLDVGHSTTSAQVVQSSEGLLSSRGGCIKRNLGGASLDKKLVDFFVQDMKKRMGVDVNLTSPDERDKRAIAKLHLCCEGLKRTLAVSNSANVAVESVKDGLDYSITLNRLKFTSMGNAVFEDILQVVKDALEEAWVHRYMIDEVILAGATSSCTGLISKIEGFFGEHTRINRDVESDQIIALGCAAQAYVLATAEDPIERQAISIEKVLDVPLLENDLLIGSGDQLEPVLLRYTALPVKKIITLQVEETGKKILSFHTGEISETSVTPLPSEDSEPYTGYDENKEGQERIEVVEYSEVGHLADLVLDLKNTSQVSIIITIDELSKISIRAMQGQEELARVGN